VSATVIDPRIDHEAWWQAELDAGRSMDDIRVRRRQMNSAVTQSNGEVREVDHHAGAAILLVKTVCEEMGVRYSIEPFDWPTPGAHVCIRTQAARFACVTSADGLTDLREAEGAALAALKTHRSSLLGTPAPVARRGYVRGA
jgi:hypothetical protein